MTDWNNTQPPEPAFTYASARQGFIRCLPLAFSAGSYGLVYGMLTVQAGLTWAETGLSSALIMAGASQFVALEMWADPLPVAALIIAALVVNLRHLLMGATLTPWLKGLPPIKVYTSLFVLTDENWALTQITLKRDKDQDAAFLLGSGVILWIFWLGSSLLGRALGGLVSDPAAWGLDFAFSAAFIALAAGMWQGKKDILPWLVAAGAAVAAQHLLPGKWYILAGGLCGSLAGLALEMRKGELRGAKRG